MDILALVLAVVGPLAVGWGAWRRIERLESAPSQPADLTSIRKGVNTLAEAIDARTDRIDALEEKVREQTLAIAEGIERVDRAERRVRSTVGRARKRMEELGYVDDTLEAEAEGLREIDGEGSPPERVQPVREDVAPFAGQDMSAFPGDWS